MFTRGREYLDSQKRSERVANYSQIGAYRTCTSGKGFPCKLCAQNSGDMSRIIEVITIEQAYVVTTIQAKHASRIKFLASQAVYRQVTSRIFNYFMYIVCIHKTMMFKC